MSDFSQPRSRNGWVDDGKQIASTVGQTCPNCGSSKYRQTLSLEECTSCGYRFDYWGGRGNDVYQKFEERLQHEARMRKIKEEFEEERNHGLL